MDFKLFLFPQNHLYLQKPNFTLAAAAVLFGAAAPGNIRNSTAGMQHLGWPPRLLS